MPPTGQAPPMANELVEVGVELLAKLEFETIPLPEAMDRIEAVTADPALQREILETAVERGLVEREGSQLRPQRGRYVSFDRDIVTKEGEFACRRCGTTLSTGYFIRFDAGELGPFGSSCIRTVTGRD